MPCHSTTGNGSQPEGRRIGVGKLVGLRNSDQLAVEVEGPLVIRADDEAANRSLPFHQPDAAVAAEVVKAPADACARRATGRSARPQPDAAT